MSEIDRLERDAYPIAVLVDRLRRERDEARTEVERLRAAIKQHRRATERSRQVPYYRDGALWVVLGEATDE